MPKISVILPTYNVSNYIDRCVQSLLSQTLEDAEFIFIDDCSTDNSLQKLKTYTDPRIKIIHHDVNKYTAEARNSGLKEATGEYISFVDPDDYIDNNFLQSLYNVAKTSDADIAKGIVSYDKLGSIHNNNKIIEENKFHFTWNLTSGIYRNKLIKDNNLKFEVDTVCFQVPAVYYANRIAITDKAIYHYTYRPDSCIHSKFTPEKWKKLNIRGADLIFDFINTHQIEIKDYILLCIKVLGLYQYGYDRLTSEEKLENKDLINLKLTNFWNNLKYKNEYITNKFNKIRSKYA